MEFGGNGELQGNGRLPQDPQPNPDINMGLPARVNQTNNSVVLDNNVHITLTKISKIMRKALPLNAKISGMSIEMVQKAVSGFITLITGEAIEICRRDHRRTVTAEDLLMAMRILGFYEYFQASARYLERYRESSSGVLEPSRGESSRERVNDPVNHAMTTIAPSSLPHYPYFFASASASASAHALAPAPAPASAPASDPAPALAPASAPAPEPVLTQVPTSGFLNDPSSASPSQVAPYLDPFWSKP